MQKGQKGDGILIFKLLLTMIVFLSLVSFTYGFNIEIKLEDQVNLHDGKCGRGSGHVWLDDCNTAVFDGSGPGGCLTSSKADGVGGCYFWESEGVRVKAESDVNIQSLSMGDLIVYMAHFGLETFENEKVNVFVNGNKVGRTDDNWCNTLGPCKELGPHPMTFSNIIFKEGKNKIRFQAVNNGGSVYVHKYAIDAEPIECIPGETETRSCGTDVGICQVGIETRTCNSDGQWDSFEGCTAIGPSTETCNGLDDDCDGSVDESLGSTTCGTGPCQRTVQNCVNGIPQTCVPGTPGAEVCNNIDDDCDNLVDDNVFQNCGSGACSGIKTCTNGVFGSCSSNGIICSTLDCDILDTACRNYNDVNAFCNVNGVCGSVSCNNFFNFPQGTVCGNPVNEFGCPFGNDLDDDTGIRLHEFLCDGSGGCDETTNPWQVDEICSNVQFCFWDGLGNGDVNYFCKTACFDNDDDGFTTCDGDCNDNNPNINPGAIEACNGVDDDCDGFIDEGLVCGECTPGELEVRTCGFTEIGICELGLQNRTCMSNAFFTPWSECLGDINPKQEICNKLDDDCDGFIDEAGVCEACKLDGISIRGSGGDIVSIGNFNDINGETTSFSAWFRKDGNNGVGILSLEAQGRTNQGLIKLRVKGKVREVFENNCAVLHVDNSFWSLATYQEPGKAPISVTFDSIVYKWDRLNGFLDIYGLGPFVNFNVTGIKVK